MRLPAGAPCASGSTSSKLSTDSPLPPLTCASRGDGAAHPLRRRPARRANADEHRIHPQPVDLRDSSARFYRLSKFEAFLWSSQRPSSGLDPQWKRPSNKEPLNEFLRKQRTVEENHRLTSYASADEDASIESDVMRHGKPAGSSPSPSRLASSKSFLGHIRILEWLSTPWSRSAGMTSRRPLSRSNLEAHPSPPPNDLQPAGRTVRDVKTQSTVPFRRTEPVNAGFSMRAGPAASLAMAGRR